MSQAAENEFITSLETFDLPLVILYLGYFVLVIFFYPLQRMHGTDCFFYDDANACFVIYIYICSTCFTFSFVV